MPNASDAEVARAIEGVLGPQSDRPRPPVSEYDWMARVVAEVERSTPALRRAIAVEDDPTILDHYAQQLSGVADIVDRITTVYGIGPTWGDFLSEVEAELPGAKAAANATAAAAAAAAADGAPAPSTAFDAEAIAREAMGI